MSNHINPVATPIATFARQVAGALQLTPAQTGTVGMVKPGAAMEVAMDGTINPVFGNETGTVADGGALAATTETANSAQATASAAMPSTVTALEALFLQWIETNPAAFGVAYGTWLDSLPTSPNPSGPAIWWNNSGTPTYS